MKLFTKVNDTLEKTKCIMILLLFFLVVYTIFLTIYVVNDDPVIQVSTRNVEEIPIPGMYIWKKKEKNHKIFLLNNDYF